MFQLLPMLQPQLLMLLMLLPLLLMLDMLDMLVLDTLLDMPVTDMPLPLLLLDMLDTLVSVLPDTDMLLKW